MKMLTLVRSNLIRQIRSRKFIWMLASIVALGVFCVPVTDAAYSVVNLGGVRGIYNSAWLGAIAVIISCAAIWVPGFFWLRSEISEDRRLRIGEMLAASPVTKVRYIAGKAFANFTLLLMLQFLFVLSFIFLQLLRGESYAINPIDYFLPLIVMSVPNLLLLAAITIIFDVIPILRGIFGGIIYMVLWTFVILGGDSTKTFDFFYMGFLLDHMLETARAFYPGLGDMTSIGYNPTDHVLATFEWGGVPWESFPAYSIMPVIISISGGIILVILSMLFFDRFMHHSMKQRVKDMLQKQSDQLKFIYSEVITLSPVTMSKHSNIMLVINEIRVMILRLPLWQALLILGGAVVLPFIPFKNITALIMLTPVILLSKMGCNNKINRTLEIVHAGCSPTRHLFTTYAAGIAVSIAVSSVQLLILAVSGNLMGVLSWLIGITFACALALFCGAFTGNKRMFEAVYVVVYYMIINNVIQFDFLGLAGSGYSFLYFGLTAAMLVACFIKSRWNYLRIWLRQVTATAFLSS